MSCLAPAIGRNGGLHRKGELRPAPVQRLQKPPEGHYVVLVTGIRERDQGNPLVIGDQQPQPQDA